VLDLTRLSAEQRGIVLAGDGPLLVIAGPGSGERFRHARGDRDSFMWWLSADQP